MRKILFLLSLLVTLAACTPTISQTSEPVPDLPSSLETQTALTQAVNPETQQPATPSPTPSAIPSATIPVVTHRIGIRVVDGVGEFYDRETGLKFYPRGYNYIRVAAQDSGADSIIYHSTFNEDLYDPAEVEENLRLLHADGYNVVRVFINHCTCDHSIHDDIERLSSAYIANMADFLEKAKANQIYVFLTTDGFPDGYWEIQDSTWSADFPGMHATYLRAGGIRAESQFWSDLINGLRAQNAPLDAIFAYGLRNELFFDTTSPPLNMTSGIVETANGRSYDMSSEEQKQLMLEEGLVFWIDSVRASILEQDPTALVTVGFFVPQGPNSAREGDTRLVVTEPVFWDSQIDFVDVHPYQGFGLSLGQYVENFGMEGMQEKPVVMGEFYAAKSVYSSPASASQAVIDWQVESCSFGFDGWLFWTYDMLGDRDFFTGMDGNGEINDALAPLNRPDPCQMQ